MIEIAEQAGVPLILAGSGPDEAGPSSAGREGAGTCSVRGTAGPRPSSSAVLGRQGLALPRPQDFGIVPVEAQACATPVIGLTVAGYARRWLTEKTGFLVAGLAPADHAAAWPGRRSFAVRHSRQARRVQSSRVSNTRMVSWLTRFS